MSNELKPCPNCGESKLGLHRVNVEGDVIDCYNCDMSSPVGVSFEHTAELWNGLPRREDFHKELAEVIRIHDESVDAMEPDRDEYAYKAGVLCGVMGHLAAIQRKYADK